MYVMDTSTLRFLHAQIESLSIDLGELVMIRYLTQYKFALNAISEMFDRPFILLQQCSSGRQWYELHIFIA